MSVSLGSSPEQVKLEEGDALEGTTLYAYKGSSHEWLTELFSPALIDWLARSEDDFGFELCNGVLVVSRDGYLSSPSDLETLCSEAAHLAAALRKESLEETATGGAKGTAAKEVDEDAVKARALVAKVKLSSSPQDLTAAKGELHGHALRSAGTLGSAAARALLIVAVVNFFGAAIPIFAVVNHSLGPLLIGEGVLFLIVFLLVYHSKANKLAENASREAFFEGYAASRKLKLEDPLEFAATHAQAGIPFKPEHVVSGRLPGGIDASLAWEGTGAKRSDKIAVIGGEKGPIASCELKSETPVLSAADLDRFAEQLGKELAGAKP
jgi:hypothetical protein